MGVERDDLPKLGHRQDTILADLRRIVTAVDGVPSTVVDAAHAAFLTRDIDAEIAALISDSRTAEGAGTAYDPVRAEEDPAQRQWLLSFQGGGVHIDIEVDDGQRRIRLLGQLDGAPVDECVVQAEGRSTRVDLDGLGRFIVEGLAHGPIRLRCLLTDGRRITTTWVVV
jgi:hypothetical protein